MDDSSSDDDSMDDEDGDAEMTEAPVPAPKGPVIDDDGFQTVTRGGRRR